MKDKKLTIEEITQLAKTIKEQAEAIEKLTSDLLKKNGSKIRRKNGLTVPAYILNERNNDQRTPG